MPIYEYHCEDCGKNFEYLTFGKDQPTCPACSSDNVDRRLSACGFVSKGKSGETISSSAGSCPCAGCTAGNCGSCGH